VGAVGPLLRLPDVRAVASVAAAFGARLAFLLGGAVALVHPRARPADRPVDPSADTSAQGSAGRCPGVHAVDLAELVALTATPGALQSVTLTIIIYIYINININNISD